jgi:hypothetical protein
VESEFCFLSRWERIKVRAEEWAWERIARREDGR